MRFGGTWTRRYCDLRPRSEPAGRRAGKEGFGGSFFAAGVGGLAPAAAPEAAAATTSATLTFRVVMTGETALGTNRLGVISCNWESLAIA